MKTIINAIQARHDEDNRLYVFSNEDRESLINLLIDANEDRAALLDIIRDIEANLTCCEYRVCKCCNHVQAILNRTEP